MFCQNCGTQISDTAKFCSKCGCAVTVSPLTSPISVSNETSVPRTNNVVPSASHAINPTAVKYILMGACILLVVVAQLLSFFAPVAGGISTFDCAVNSDALESCVEYIEDIAEGYSSDATAFTLFYCFILYFIAMLLSSFSFTALSRYRIIGIGRIVAAVCCSFCALTNILTLDLMTKSEWYHIKTNATAFIVPILYIGAVVLGVISNKIGAPSKATPKKSLLSRALPKHISGDVRCDGNYPTTSDFEHLIYKLNLRSILSDSSNSDHLFNAVNEKLYKTFYKTLNQTSSNTQMFSYSDEYNQIYGMIKVCENTIFIDLNINM